MRRNPYDKRDAVEWMRTRLKKEPTLRARDLAAGFQDARGLPASDWRDLYSDGELAKRLGPRTGPRRNPTNQRRRKTMAKRTRRKTRKWGSPAQRAAFRKMIAARGRKSSRRARRSSSRSPKRARRKVTSTALTRRTTVVVLAPGGAPGTKKRKNPRRKKGQRIMAKRRRRKSHRRAVASSSFPRRRRRVRRRRNPGGGGMGAIVKQTISTAIPALAGGAVMGLVDTKILGNASTPVRIGGKLALAAIAGRFLRKRPATAYTVMGAMLGTAGYDLGVRFGGGAVAPTPAAAAQQLKSLVYEDPAALRGLVYEMGRLQIQQEPSLGESVAQEFQDVNLG